MKEVIKKEAIKVLARCEAEAIDSMVRDRVAAALQRISSNKRDVARWTRELLEAECGSHYLDFRPFPDSHFRKSLMSVANRAAKLQDSLAKLPVDCDLGGQWNSLQDCLPKLIKAADDELAELTRKRGGERGWKGSGRPPAIGAKHVAEVAGAAYFSIRDKRPGRSVVYDVRKGKFSEKGDFLNFLRDVFGALGRTESAANLARYAASILAHRPHRGVA